MTVDDAARALGCSPDDLRALVEAADVALVEYGSEERVASARRAAESLGLSFKRDHG